MVPIKIEEESDATMRARLVESLSHSFPGSALSQALHAMDEHEEIELEPLSSSCFAELQLDKVKIEEDDEDEELTSLTWLQDNDLLKNLDTGDRSLCASPSDMYKENQGLLHGGIGQPHPPHIPYNPQKHVNSKPPYSFSCLIFMSIEDSPQKKLPVKDIYNWILTHFPYFQNAPTGWKNSVRHNLSLNKCFKKVDKEKGSNIGKGSLWCIDPDFRPNLLQALRKTPYHPYHQLQILNNIQPHANNYTVVSRANNSGDVPKLGMNSPSPHLFPFLSKHFSKLDSDSDIDVANTLMSLKKAGLSRRPLSTCNGWKSGGTRSRSPSPPEFGSEKEKEMLRRKQRACRSPIVLVTRPSSDHTYSVTESQLRSLATPHSPGSSIDEEYDFGESDLEEDSFSDTDYAGSEGEKVKKSTFSKQKVIPSESSPFKRRLVERIDDDEELKLVEGADALLNLAGIKTAQIVPLRSISPSTNNNNIDVKIEPKDDYEKDISGESQQEGTSQSMFAECNDSDEERLQIAEGSDSNIDNSKIKGNMAMKIKVEADPTRSINLPNAVENKSQNTL